MVRYIAENDEEASTLYEPAPKAYLVLLVNGRVSQSFPLRGEIQLGRDKSNSVVVSDQKVSRHHAMLTPIGDAFIISDLGSANGTYLNGVLITQPVRLKDKDRIGVGDTHFLFSTSEPDPNDVNQFVFSSPSFSPQEVPPKTSFTIAAPGDISIWMVVGCLGLIIVGLLLLLAVLVGLFVGRGQGAGVVLPGIFWPHLSVILFT